MQPGGEFSVDAAIEGFAAWANNVQLAGKQVSGAFERVEFTGG